MSFVGSNFFVVIYIDIYILFIKIKNFNSLDSPKKYVFPPPHKKKNLLRNLKKIFIF